MHTTRKFTRSVPLLNHDQVALLSRPRFSGRAIARTCRLSGVVFLAALIAAAATSARAGDARNVSPQKEKELLAVLRSDAPAAEKAITCKNLAIYGSSESVSDLAKLLPDARLSSWARIALEAIPGPAADEALRNAAQSLQGKLLVGMINSIGVRRDANAIDTLTARLQDDDSEVAAAAAVALGRIGNAAATNVLRQSLAAAPDKVRSAIAEGCVLCAERLHSEGKSADAARIYDEVRNADVPKQRVIEASRGAILARNQAGIPLLLEQFRSSDKLMFNLALVTVREFPGGQVDKDLAAEMVRATPERAALMIQAMADREETVVLAAVLNAAQQGHKHVRLSAIDALRRIGDDSCLSALLKIALEDDADLAQAAKETLANLPGAKVDAQIVTLVSNAEGKQRPLLIELVGQRRIIAVTPLLAGLDHSDPAVRSAALIALGETVTLKRLPVLVSQVVAPKYPEDAQVARQALEAASIRMPDREACAIELTAAIESASSASTKSSLLEILSAVEGKQALQTLAAAAKSDDPQLQDTGSRLLGKWNGVDAAPVLLDLAKTAPAEKYRIRALRGYIGLARKFAMPARQRATMCQNALAVARRPAEKKLVLDVLKLHPSAATLKLAIKMMQEPVLKDEATQTVLAIAKKLGNKRADVNKLLSSAGLDKVK